jgi:hypothetical protein
MKSGEGQFGALFEFSLTGLISFREGDDHAYALKNAFHQVVDAMQ